MRTKDMERHLFYCRSERSEEPLGLAVVPTQGCSGILFQGFCGRCRSKIDQRSSERHVEII